MEKLPCVDCESCDSCDVYGTVERTLDKTQNFAKLDVTLSFLVNPEDVDDFKDAWSDSVAQEIGLATARCAEKICKVITNEDSRILPLGAHLNMNEVTNKEAFEVIREFIKETHD